MLEVLKRRVAFHETDCMGVVHHSNYVKYFEEARVEFLYQSKLEAFHAPNCDYILAVINLEAKYRRPLKVGDLFSVHIEPSLQGAAQVNFDYKVFLADTLVTDGKTSHVGLNSELKVVKPPKELIKGFKEYGS